MVKFGSSGNLPVFLQCNFVFSHFESAIASSRKTCVIIQTLGEQVAINLRYCYSARRATLRMLESRTYYCTILCLTFIQRREVAKAWEHGCVTNGHAWQTIPLFFFFRDKWSSSKGSSLAFSWYCKVFAINKTAKRLLLSRFVLLGFVFR